MTYNKGWLTQTMSGANCSSTGTSCYNVTTFDGLGRVWVAKQTTDGSPYSFTNGLDLAGDLTSLTYPGSGRVVNASYNSYGQIQYVTGTLGSSTTNYAGSSSVPITYSTHGAITSMTLGNGLVETTQFNTRLQPTQIQAGSLMTLGFTYASTTNNGNLATQTITRPSWSAVQSYSYDGANRLSSVSQSGSLVWSEGYAYDSVGNRWDTSYGPGTPVVEVPQGTTSSSPYTSGTNQLSAWYYDPAGNLLAIPSSGGSVTRASCVPSSVPSGAMRRTACYDAENRMYSETPASGTTSTYGYDGDGRRIKKTVGTGTPIIYVYDPQGNLAQEYGTPVTTGTDFLTADHLGSTRLVTTDGALAGVCHDFKPFGEELPKACTTYSSDTTIMFTGKERDAENQGLDFFGARYMSSWQGRFTSVDPISGTVLHLLNPQRWNMYAYAVNNPLAYTDPDGRDAIAVKFGNLAHDLGHAGVASVHHDGKGTFADFGPQHGGQAHDAGKYDFIDFKTQIQYGADGKPTKASLTALANELADAELQPHDSVSVAYFKTSDSETAALDAYINAAEAQQANGKTPTYWVGFRDCIWFCMNGMQKAGVGPGSSTLTVPNFQYFSYWLGADQTATGTNPPEEKVTSKICYNDENGKQVCQ